MKQQNRKIRIGTEYRCNNCRREGSTEPFVGIFQKKVEQISDQILTLYSVQTKQKNGTNDYNMTEYT